MSALSKGGVSFSGAIVPIVHLLPDAPLGELPIWLTSHAELRTSRRVRRVFDYLAEELNQAFRAKGSGAAS